MSDVLSAATRSLDMLSIAMRGLDAVGKLAKDQIGNGGDKAMDALAAIARIVEAVRDGFHASVDPGKVADEITHLRAALASNDAAIDAELDKKFPR